MKKRGFTLIELLVVITVIGLLSSVVLVAVKGSREKAKLAKAQEFSASINSVLGAYAIGVWRFDETSGSTAFDNSGFGNNCSFSGAVSHTTAGIFSSALTFSGGNLDCGRKESLSPGTGSFTLEAWIKTADTGDNKNIVSGYTGGEAFTIYLDSGRLVSRIYDGAVNVQSTGSITTNDSSWHHIAVSFDRKGNMTKYVDAKKDAADSIIAASRAINGVQFRIGAGPGATGVFSGAIDEVRYYTQALSVSEIQKHYARGLINHQLVRQ